MHVHCIISANTRSTIAALAGSLPHLFLQLCFSQCYQSNCLLQEARADLDAADELDPYNMKAAEVRRKLSMVSARGKGSEAAVCAKMFEKGI